MPIFIYLDMFFLQDEEIYQLFSEIKDLESSIEAVRVVRDPHIGLGKGIAYKITSDYLHIKWEVTHKKCPFVIIKWSILNL